MFGLRMSGLKNMLEDVSNKDGRFLNGEFGNLMEKRQKFGERDYNEPGLRRYKVKFWLED